MSTDKAKDPRTEKGVYDWMPKDPGLPKDIVINATGHAVVIGAPARVKDDNPRLDPGDRRQGAEWVKLAMTSGLQNLANISVERARDLEKKRRQRLGEEPQDWMIEAANRSAQQKAGGAPAAAASSFGRRD